MRRNRWRKNRGGQLRREPAEQRRPEHDPREHFPDDRRLTHPREQHAKRAARDQHRRERQQHVEQRVGLRYRVRPSGRNSSFVLFGASATGTPASHRGMGALSFGYKDSIGPQTVSTRSVKKVPALRGKVVVNAFFEDSTRTRMSFSLAAQRLSADVIEFTEKGSELYAKA